MAILVALFIVVPIVELYVIIQVGGADRRLADAGAAARRRPARLAAAAPPGPRRLAALQRGPRRAPLPRPEVADGLLIAIGGTLLLTPGFITDIFGLFLLIPPTRAIVRRLLRGYAGRFVVVGMPGAGQFGSGREPGGPGASRDYDFEATAEEAPVDGNRKLPRTDE